MNCDNHLSLSIKQALSYSLNALLFLKTHNETQLMKNALTCLCNDSIMIYIYLLVPVTIFPNNPILYIAFLNSLFKRFQRLLWTENYSSLHGQTSGFDSHSSILLISELICLNFDVHYVFFVISLLSRFRCLRRKRRK